MPISLCFIEPWLQYRVWRTYWTSSPRGGRSQKAYRRRSNRSSWSAELSFCSVALILRSISKVITPLSQFHFNRWNSTVVPVLIWRGNSFCMFTSKSTWLWMYTSQILQRWRKLFNIGCAICIFASILVNFWPILKILFSPESLWKLQFGFYSHCAN